MSARKKPPTPPHILKEGCRFGHGDTLSGELIALAQRYRTTDLPGEGTCGSLAPEGDLGAQQPYRLGAPLGAGTSALVLGFIHNLSGEVCSVSHFPGSFQLQGKKFKFPWLSPGPSEWSWCLQPGQDLILRGAGSECRLGCP